MIREISSGAIVKAVSRLCQEANCLLDNGIRAAFCRALECEEDFLSKDVLERLVENADIAAEERVPICQDTGMAVVFVELGQNVHITGELLEDAINRGVRDGYKEGFLRKSVVSDPVNRVNTGDNTPAVIHVKITAGDGFKITVAPKGFGSENMSRLIMLKPSQGVDGVKDFVVETVKAAGPNPCPPIIAGVGVGGTMEKAALLAKEALLRELGVPCPDPFWAGVESELLARVNALNIGPGGFGGKTTALAVHINPWPTHIAGLPVCVNIGCHVTRHASAEL